MESARGKTGPSGTTAPAVQAAHPAQPGLHVAAGFTLLLIALSFAPQIQGNARLLASFWGAAAVLVAWQLALYLQARRSGRVLCYEVVLRKPHYVQAAVQATVYAYWGWHWPEVYDHLPHIAAQIVFAYALDMLLTWSRRDRFVLGFGPFPIIFSTNLFLWFHDDWFSLQFAMVALGIFGKEFITWQREGQRTHIFNPSAFTLAVFSLGLLLTGTTDISWGEEIARTLAYPEHIYLEIFLVGLIVQALFYVTLTTLGAALMLLALNALYMWVTGVYYFLDSSIPIAVFLGLHLLVTDPATSPRTDFGRIVFGALYGAGVFALYGLLSLLGEPTFYDKLLCVPLLNLGVRGLDRLAHWEPLQRRRVDQLGLALPQRQRNLVYMSVWIAVFVAASAYGWLGKHHPGARAEFWQQACAEDRRGACRSLSVIYGNHCEAGSANACNALGVLLMERGGQPGLARKAVPAFERACLLGAEAGCANAAIQSLYHSAETAFSAPVLAYLYDGCEEGNGRACHLLASAEAAGRGVSPDPVAAMRHYERSCEAGWSAACGDLGRLHLRGDSGEVDPVAAAAAFELACEASDALSCLHLALIYRNGDAQAPPGVSPRGLVERACTLGLEDACRVLAGLDD